MAVGSPHLYRVFRSAIRETADILARLLVKWERIRVKTGGEIARIGPARKQAGQT